MEARAIRKLVARSFREGAELRLRLTEECTDAVVRAAQAVQRALQHGGKILLFGNGGSAADAQHIAAELVGRFARERDPLPAIALTTNTSVLTALGNDYGFEQIFARQVRALGRRADVAIAISTSGRSPNVIEGARAAGKLGLVTIGLTGGGGGPLARMVDVALVVPSTNIARIQECHITLGHILCESADALFHSRTGVGGGRSSAAGRKKIALPRRQG
jgi:D-sedoheptulose 7-phosphate isomerase